MELVALQKIVDRSLGGDIQPGKRFTCSDIRAKEFVQKGMATIPQLASLPRKKPEPEKPADHPISATGAEPALSVSPVAPASPSSNASSSRRGGSRRRRKKQDE